METLIQAASTSNTSANFCQIKRLYIPEASHLHTSHREILKSHWIVDSNQLDSCACVSQGLCVLWWVTCICRGLATGRLHCPWIATICLNRFGKLTHSPGRPTHRAGYVAVKWWATWLKASMGSSYPLHLGWLALSVSLLHKFLRDPAWHVYGNSARRKIPVQRLITLQHHHFLTAPAHPLELFLAPNTSAHPNSITH
jgi:hypothetical protein